jgi:hypothetical protein
MTLGSIRNDGESRRSIGLSQAARTHLKEMAERERFELSMGQ